MPEVQGNLARDLTSNEGVSVVLELFKEERKTLTGGV
jgi:hypothetical protein